MTQPQHTTLPSERLALLVRLALDLNASLDPDEVLRKVMDEVIKLTHAERGFVMLLDDPQRKVDEQFITAIKSQLHVPVSHGIDPATVASQEFNVSRGVIDRVLKEGEPLLTNDAQNDSRFMARQSVILLKLRSILCVPLKVKDRMLGIIYVDNRIQAGIFSPADLELLSVVAATAAIAIENARLYQVAVEKGRMERELQMAHRVQSSLLPRQMPALAGWEIAARWLPAREVAGDYYDFIIFESNEQNNSSIGLVIGDVTDKGMPAALFMAFARSTLRASAYSARSAAEAVQHANVLISADSYNSMFITLVYAQLDPLSGKFTYVNAGHNPPYHVQPSKPAALSRLSTTGIPLGIDEGNQYTQNQVILNPGEFIVFYTDGVTDALSPEGEIFGNQRLEEIILENQGKSANDLIAQLENKVLEFMAKRDPFDDITLMVLRRLPLN